MIETPGVSPDEVAVSSVLSACAHLGSLEMGRKIQNYLMQNRFYINVYIGSALADIVCLNLGRNINHVWLTCWAMQEISN
ncbi:hypothetical protein GIB67_042547 [Kingdonia uniflora]|uniref:Uncharacterized protein n=1 Tax=Kingdonia uniflora TaxID=39325 RepID=A0A7J7M1D6_9MAGN|nr:hypothetical protein GIB67_042547 [Kingdonia uniflora]